MAPVYVLDACVLYPVVLRDLLLTLAALDSFEPRWTEAIIDEMTRDVLADRPSIDPAHFDARVIGAMRRAFPAASVEGYEYLIDGMDNHPKDRHVAAAAVRCGAAAVVTYNVRDFDTELLRKRGLPSSRHRNWWDDSLQTRPAWLPSRCGRWRRARSGRRCRLRMSSRRSSANKASERSKIRYKCWSIDAGGATTP